MTFGLFYRRPGEIGQYLGAIVATDAETAVKYARERWNREALGYMYVAEPPMVDLPPDWPGSLAMFPTSRQRMVDLEGEAA